MLSIIQLNPNKFFHHQCLFFLPRLDYNYEEPKQSEINQQLAKGKEVYHGTSNFNGQRSCQLSRCAHGYDLHHGQAEADSTSKATESDFIYEGFHRFMGTRRGEEESG